jgi:transposase
VLGCTSSDHSDALWDLIQPLLPSPLRKPKGGRPRLPDRACLTGVLFVLRSGIPWEMLPKEMGCGSGMSCWRRLRDWPDAGIWQLIHFSLLDSLAPYGQSARFSSFLQLNQTQRRLAASTRVVSAYSPTATPIEVGPTASIDQRDFIGDRKLAICLEVQNGNAG